MDAGIDKLRCVIVDIGPNLMGEDSGATLAPRIPQCLALQPLAFHQRGHDLGVGFAGTVEMIRAPGSHFIAPQARHRGPGKRGGVFRQDLRTSRSRQETRLPPPVFIGEEKLSGKAGVSYARSRQNVIKADWRCRQVQNAEFRRVGVADPK